jgi:hypothetical protein
VWHQWRQVWRQVCGAIWRYDLLALSVCGAMCVGVALWRKCVALYWRKCVLALLWRYVLASVWRYVSAMCGKYGAIASIV